MTKRQLELINAVIKLYCNTSGVFNTEKEDEVVELPYAPWMKTSVKELKEVRSEVKKAIRAIDRLAGPVGERKSVRRRNDKVQFEFKTVFSKHLIKEAYEWCVANLPLKEDRGLIYQVDEMYIVTSSQKIIDKVNEHFGSKFSFENAWENRIWFLEDKK